MSSQPTQAQRVIGRFKNVAEMSRVTGLKQRTIGMMLSAGTIHQKNWRPILAAREHAPGLTIWDFIIPIMNDVGFEHLVPDLTTPTSGTAPASPNASA